MTSLVGRLRRSIVTGGFAVLALGGMVTAATSSSASTSHAVVASAATSGGVTPVPRSARGCNNYIGIFLGTPSNGHAIIQGYICDTIVCRPTGTFHGHFEVTGPNGYVRNSPTESFPDGDGFQWTIPATVGKWCITGWASPGGKAGRACENIE
jgi:hypothetical protein